MDKDISRVLIYGFGRMGLTHFSILNQIIPTAKFTFVEPNNRLNFLLQNNIKASFNVKDNFSENFDLSLITTPPFAHRTILEKCLTRGDKKIFVEKPFGGFTNHDCSYTYDKIYIGYVLRFNSVVNWIKNNIQSENIVEINAEYFSNTISSKPKGWRNGNFSGVLNEMGSHIIDLLNYLFDLNDFEIISSDLKSVITDVDDIVNAEIISLNKKINIRLNWVDSTKRKPVFSFELILKNKEKVKFDQQKIYFYKNEMIINEISTVNLTNKIPYYLRGTDFTLQMQDLVNECKTICKIDDAVLVNAIMKKIKEK